MVDTWTVKKAIKTTFKVQGAQIVDFSLATSAAIVFLFLDAELSNHFNLLIVFMFFLSLTIILLQLFFEVYLNNNLEHKWRDSIVEVMLHLWEFSIDRDEK